MTTFVDPALVQAYLETTEAALANQQLQHAEALLRHIRELMLPILRQSQYTSRPAMKLMADVGLDVGKKRQGRPNEDYAFAARGFRSLPGGELEPFGLFIVADGIGGHARGFEASHLATHACVDYVFPRVALCPARGPVLMEILLGGVQEANRAVFRRNGGNRPEDNTDEERTVKARMGTTMTAMLIVGPEAYIANVGDSRTYLYRDGKLIQITEDHSRVAQLVREGAIKPHEVYTHPQRNVIYRSLGHQPRAEIDTFYRQLQDDDVLLLCSDGLWEMAPDQAKIAHILSSPLLSVRDIAGRLVRLALDGGGLDNIGLVVVQVRMDTAALPTMVQPPEQSYVLPAPRFW
jgi:serine/threonine protein phosphatase PrpC